MYLLTLVFADVDTEFEKFSMNARCALQQRLIVRMSLRVSAARQDNRGAHDGISKPRIGGSPCGASQ